MQTKTNGRGFIDGLFHWRSNDNLIIEQYRSLRPQVPAMYAAIAINILFLAYLTSGSTNRDTLILPAVVVVAIVVRLAALWWTGTGATGAAVATMRTSMTTTLIVACLLSVGLNVWTHLLTFASPEVRAYIALFTALCTICCATCLSSLPLAAYLVIAIGTIPISISFLFTGDTVTACMGANILLVAPLMIGMVHRNHVQLRRMVASREVLAAEKIKVSDLAYRDSLTGLANRRAFLDALKDAVAARPAHALAVGMLDLDGFKVINDTYGHRVGDDVLVAVGQRFQRLGIGDALVARLGGDEFAVLLRDVDGLDDARQRLGQVDAVFDQPFVAGGHTLRLRATIGLAHDAADGATLALINRADLAMYEGKRAGSHGAAISLFEPGMEARTRRRIAVEQALATPAESDLIRLHYQPVVATATNKIVAFEALARWTHPTLGVIPPGEFIPLAERAGMTEQLTLHLLSLALRDASAWPPAISLSFNVSAAELTSPSLASRILALLAEHGRDPRRLSIEVTETALLCDFAAARSVLSALKRGGVRILLDDFGAGYASIGYLREMQFDGIKLDGSLVATLMDSAAAHDLLVGVLHLCKAIGCPVTAEMVETSAQHDVLRALGVQALQGNFLSPPLPIDKAVAASVAGFLAVPAVSSLVALRQYG